MRGESIRIRGIIASLVLLALASNAFAVLNIVATFDDNPVVWSATRKAVVNQAIQDWEDAFNAYVVDGTVYYSTQLIEGGASLAQTSNWIYGYEPALGASTRPWLGVGHWMRVNPSLWWDPTPGNDGDGIFGEDALTIVRHELGHVLGVWPNMWYDDYAPGKEDLWDAQIVGNVFDPGGLNVSMTGDHGHTNVWGDLMYYGYTGGRTDVDQTMLMFAKAFNLQPIPEPMTMTLLAMGGIAVLAKRRKA